MILKTTRDNLYQMFRDMSANDIIDYLEGYGLEFEELPAIPRGIYRREEGTDLAYYDGYGEWTRVDWSGYGETNIVWACMDYENRGDWWIQVLNEYLAPIQSYNAFRFQMNENGVRLA